jgi:hypothetical protein
MAGEHRAPERPYRAFLSVPGRHYRSRNPHEDPGWCVMSADHRTDDQRTALAQETYR